MEVLAPVRRFRARRELLAARRAADAELITARLPSPRLAWRTNELCSDEHRRELAESVVDVVRASESRHLPTASPINRPAAREETTTLLRLAAALTDTEHGVAPRGVLLVERLLFGTASPLYDQAPRNRLHVTLAEALQALEAGR
jgi:hypothetical protein